jgi:hypothetical protein
MRCRYFVDLVAIGFVSCNAISTGSFWVFYNSFWIPMRAVFSEARFHLVNFVVCWV